jgi:hypothetical protein
MAALGANDDVALELLPEFDFPRFGEDVLGGDAQADRLLSKSSTTTRPLRAFSDNEHTTVGTRLHTEGTPQPLQYTTWRWYSVIATNVALCSLTTPFLVLAITNAMLNFRTVRPSQLDEIQSLNKLVRGEASYHLFILNISAIKVLILHRPQPFSPLFFR